MSGNKETKIIGTENNHLKFEKIDNTTMNISGKFNEFGILAIVAGIISFCFLLTLL